MEESNIAPSAAPPSGFVSSEFLSTLIGFVLVIWQMLAGHLDPALAGAIVAGGAAAYTICRTALKIAHANGYAKAFPDLPDISFGPGGGKQGGFAHPRALLALALMAGTIMACAVAPKTATQGVVLLHGEYQAAADGILAYKRLPMCGAAGAGRVCADVAVVARLKSLDACAYAALTMAEAAVRETALLVDVSECLEVTGRAAITLASTNNDPEAMMAAAKQLVATLAGLVATLAPPK